MMERLDTGKVLTGIFATYRQQFAVLVPAALVVYLVPALVGLLLLGGGAGPFMAVAVTVGAGIVAGVWYQGMVVEAVRDMRDGVRDFTLPRLVRSVAPVVVPLVGAGLLAAIAIAVGLIAFVVPGLVLLTWWAVVAPVIVIERASVPDAFSRSRNLVKGNGWNVFGVIVLLYLLQFVASGILGVFARGSLIGRTITDLVVSVLVAPLTGLAAATMYFELRRIKGEDAPAAAAEAVSSWPPPAMPPTEAPPGPPAPPTPPPAVPPTEAPPGPPTEPHGPAPSI
ncbi:MAG: hypothetical protein ACRDJ4_00345 [Actinomycetota bacterium]